MYRTRNTRKCGDNQNGNPADAEELNITAGGRYTVKESEQSPFNSRYTNCTDGDQLYQYELKLMVTVVLTGAVLSLMVTTPLSFQSHGKYKC